MSILKFAYNWFLSADDATVKSLGMVIVGILGILFKMDSERRNKVAHAISYAVTLLKVGKVDKQSAINHVLATGGVKKKVAETLIEKIEKIHVNKFEDGETSYEIKPTKGIKVVVNSDGVNIDPSGLINKSEYKLKKFFKKVF